MRLALVPLALLLSACGGGGDVEAGTPATTPPTSDAGDESQPSEGDGTFTPEYDSTAEVVAELQASGIECQPDDPMSPTAYAAESQWCFTTVDESDGYTVAVYDSGQQQGEANVWLTQENPGTTYVWGTGWSVGAPSGSDGSEVVAAIGGTAVEG